MLAVKSDHFLKPKMPPLLLVENAGLDFGFEGFVSFFFATSLACLVGAVPSSRWSKDSPVVAAI